MIINTEDENDQDYYDEVYGEEYKEEEARYIKQRLAQESGVIEEKDDDLYGDEDDDDEELNESNVHQAALSYFQRHKQFPPMQRIPVEAEYMSNPSDVIDEEEFEDSETDPTSPLKKALKMQ